jgi:hypothetical protein
MSNSATLVDVIPVQSGGQPGVSEYEIVIDTTGTDLDIQTPTGTNRVWLSGFWLSEGTVLNLTFKSKNAAGTASKTQTFELAANQGSIGYISNGFYFVTKPGETFSMQSSVAIGAAVGKNLVLRVTEAETFRVN